jgi:hypothetical protein
MPFVFFLFAVVVIGLRPMPPEGGRPLTLTLSLKGRGNNDTDKNKSENDNAI